MEQFGSWVQPARTDIPKASSGDIFYTGELMMQVQFMVAMEKERIAQIKQYEALPAAELIQKYNVKVPKELWTRVMKEQRVDNEELQSESGEENQENAESSNEMIGQKGSDDESSEGQSEADDL